MDEQNIQYIELKDLILWSENPRDPIDSEENNIVIIENALKNPRGKKWDLVNFARSMGNTYDYSEIPTVVLKNGKYIIYDGNRRVILGMLSKNIYNIKHNIINIPNYPDKIPCNVCTEEFALSSIFRKHAGQNGTWSHLERDIFEHKYLKKEKSHFLLLDELTRVISNYPSLNQGFVRDEILTLDNLKKLEIEIINKKLLTSNNIDEINEIFSILDEMIRNKTLSTRNNRKNITPLLNHERINKIISTNKNKPKVEIHQQTEKKTKDVEPKPISKKRTPKTRSEIQHELFGGKLNLKPGNVNNLYRDLDFIYRSYLQNRSNFSPNFSGLIRMGLRLLVEIASRDTKYKEKISQYIQEYFRDAKEKLDQDQKTTLSTQNITEKTISQLLQLGAHDYTASYNEAQTIALSLIIGQILLITHGTKKQALD